MNRHRFQGHLVAYADQLIEAGDANIKIRTVDGDAGIGGERLVALIENLAGDGYVAWSGEGDFLEVKVDGREAVGIESGGPIACAEGTTVGFRAVAKVVRPVVGIVGAVVTEEVVAKAGWVEARGPAAIDPVHAGPGDWLPLEVVGAELEFQLVGTPGLHECGLGLKGVAPELLHRDIVDEAGAVAVGAAGVPSVHLLRGCELFRPAQFKAEESHGLPGKREAVVEAAPFREGEIALLKDPA